MDFFQHQEDARRITRRLVVLFLLAVVAIVLAVNAAAVVIWLVTAPTPEYAVPVGQRLAALPRGFFVNTTLLTLLVVAGGTAFETLRLRDGGDAVAQMVGGRLVAPDATDLAERRLLNIVEEMALASGITVPRVYVLDAEHAINAFAAGFSPNQAVVAVSRGALDRLSRDELQGVVAHEFSHVLNGDMRLNIRLIGVLYGILLLAILGGKLMQVMRYARVSGDRRSRGMNIGAALFLGGLALWIIGSIGVFFARIIKAAVSRQREFLADASAVQFTRNPDGIGGALRKIEGLSALGALGSQIENPHAETLSHLFMGAAKPSLAHGLWATHPPIEERVRRIYGRAMPMLEAPEVPASATPSPAPGGNGFGHAFGRGNLQASALADAAYEGTAAASGTAAGTSDAGPAPLGASPAQHAAEEALVRAARDPQQAPALVFALLLASDAGERTAQLAALEEFFPGLSPTAEALARHLTRVDWRTPLLDLSVPALRERSEADRRRILIAAGKLVELDKRVTLSEFVLQTMLERRLSTLHPRDVAVRHRLHGALAREIGLSLSLVAQVAARGDPARAQASFERGRAWLSIDAAMTPAARLNFPLVRDALRQLNQLAPLAKPALIKAWIVCAVGKTGEDGSLTLETADLVRALCSALDAPLPPQVSARYAAAEAGLARHA